jgi:hypothetical protein
MRYSVRRLRRKLPKATIMLGCWAEDIDKEALEEYAAASLREAMMICRAIAGLQETNEEPDIVTAFRIA